MAAPTVEDRVLIRELYARVYWAMNFADVGALQECWSPEGQIVRYTGEFRTPADSAATATDWYADPIATTRQHHLTNLIVDADTDGHEDRRATRAYFLVTEVADPPMTRVRWSCYSHDVVEKVDGAWRFLKRQIHLNHPEAG